MQDPLKGIFALIAAGALGLCWYLILSGEAAPAADPPGFAKHVVADNISARSLVIVDEKGNRRLSMGVADGNPMFAMHDAQNRMRMWMSFEPTDGFRLTIYDGTEPQHERMQLIVKDDGVAGLSFHDAKGKTRGVFGAVGLGDPGVVFYNDKGDQIWSAP